MKKLVSLLILILPLFASANTFETDMSKAMNQFRSAENVKDFVLASKSFEQVAVANPTQWEPAYYEAFCLVTAGFDALEFGEKEAYLNKAEAKIDNMLATWGNNDEIWTLKALCLSAQLVSDMRKAPSLSPQITACTRQALAISPTNPRAQYLKIRNEMGLAQFMGHDVAPMCADAAAVLSVFHDYKMVSEWSPSWGEDLLKQISTSCKK